MGSLCYTFPKEDGVRVVRKTLGTVTIPIIAVVILMAGLIYRQVDRLEDRVLKVGERSIRNEAALKAFMEGLARSGRHTTPEPQPPTARTNSEDSADDPAESGRFPADIPRSVVKAAESALSIMARQTDARGQTLGQ